MATSSTLHDVALEQLESVVGVDVYDAEVPATPRQLSDGRVAAYAVLYASPGNLYASALDGGQGALLGSFQVTCVGGDVSRALACVDAVRTAMVGPVDVDGVTRVIRAREFDPGPVRPDDGAWPPRWFVPLEFQLFAP